MSGEPEKNPYSSTTIIEYGLKLDCVKSGCDPLHEDHGRVFYVSGEKQRAIKAGKHMLRPVRRVRTITPWVDTDV